MPVRALLYCVSLLWICVHNAVAVERVTVDSVADAWKEREGRFEYATIRWTEQKVTAKGGIIREGGHSYDYVENVSNADVPPYDAVHNYHRELNFVGGDTQYSYNEPGWNTVEERFVNRQVDATFVNQEFRQLRVRDAEERFPVTGLISKEPNLITTMVVLRPVLVNFRPTSSGHVERLRRYSVTDEIRTFDGSNCIILAYTREHGVRSTLWLDVDNGFIVRRWLSEIDGQILGEQNVYYDELDDGVLIPAHWEYAMYWPDGTLQMAFETLAVACVVNERMDPLTAVLFPPDTLVTDVRDRDARPLKFVVLEDGSWQSITRGELRKESIPDISDRHVSRRVFFVLGGLTFVVLCVVALSSWVKRKYKLVVNRYFDL